MNISYGNGEVALETNDKVVGLQIHFTGKINIESNLPDDFNVYLGNNKIIIFSMNLDVLSELLFTYKGTFRIDNCIASNKHGEKIDINIQNYYLGYWQRQNNTWETGSKWQDLKSKYTIGYKVFKQKNNLPELTKEQKDIVKRIKKRAR
tara:strand:- start:2370 stop:2816 length:447 start_codon:yes stop_codon:yes gene_type:complete